MKTDIALANSASPVGISDMWHLIWFFNVDQSTHLGASYIKGSGAAIDSLNLFKQRAN